MSRSHFATQLMFATVATLAFASILPGIFPTAQAWEVAGSIPTRIGLPIPMPVWCWPSPGGVSCVYNIELP